METDRDKGAFKQVVKAGVTVVDERDLDLETST